MKSRLLIHFNINYILITGFISISKLDKIVDLKGKRIPKKHYPALIKHHNMLNQPSIPKYYFSIANPYLFGGRLNRNC